MKKVVLFLSAIFVFLCMAFSAWAVPTTWEVSENYVPPYYISFMNGQLLYLDLGDDGYVSGMDINDFTLTIRVSDDSGDKWYEKAEHILLLAGTDSNGTWSVGDLSVGWSMLGDFDIEHDGTLNFLVTSGFGDFYLNSAKVVATGDDGTTSVPEPATMMLLGLGLLGLVGVRRKIQK